jgi:hypothetical protein
MELRQSGPGSGRRAQTLVEFALMLPIFLVLVFGLIDFARVMQANVTIQHAAREAGRYAVTGNRIDGRSRPESIKDVAGQQIVGLPVSPGVAASQPGFFQVDLSPENGGAAGELVEVHVRYTVEPLTPVLRAFTATIPLHASVLVRNELFGIAPSFARFEVPPTPPPPPTYTPTPAPTATPTLVPTVTPTPPATPTPT